MLLGKKDKDNELECKIIIMIMTISVPSSNIRRRIILH